jgi:hypothetical protein
MRKIKGMEVPPCLATMALFTNVDAEHVNSSQPLPVFFWEEIPTLTFCVTWCSSCWCQVGHKGAPKSHGFCPRTFPRVQFPTAAKARKPWPSGAEYLLLKKLADPSAWWNGRNQQTSSTACVYPCFHHGANVTAPHDGG